jgi:hypothetical protein
MAVEFFVTKNGHPVSGALVYYSKTTGHGERRTDGNGYATFNIDPGQTTCIRINGKDQGNRYLRNGVNEFKIWVHLPIGNLEARLRVSFLYSS